MTDSTVSPAWPAIRGIIADLDGVVYRGDTAIPSAVDAFRAWAARGVPYRFVTNNSTQTPEAFAAKLRRLGVAVTADQVVTSSATTARTLQKSWAPGTPIFAIGAQALTDALTGAGFVIDERRAKVVVVGLDRALTYARLKVAVAAVLAGATLIGTNPDPVLPVEDGFEPGAGSILAAVATASGATPVIIGKPETPMIATALESLGTARGATVMIGDQISTDILAGQRTGLRSILVTTGVRNDGPQLAVPDLIVASLGDIPLG